MKDGTQKEKQKKLSARQIAKANGDKHYEGGKCGRCGQTQRYVVSATCVNCNKRRARTKLPLIDRKGRPPAQDGTQEDLNFAAVVRKVYERQSRW